MAAKGESLRGRAEALPGLARAHHVDPGVRRARARVHIEPVALIDGQWKPRQKGSVRRVEPRARPGDRRRCGRVHGVARAEHRGIVIAEYRDRAGFDHLRHLLDDPCGVGPIADQIAEKHVAFGAGAARHRQGRRSAPHGCHGYRRAGRSASWCSTTRTTARNAPRPDRRRESVQDHDDQIRNGDREYAATGAEHQDTLESCHRPGSPAIPSLKTRCANQLA